MMASSDTGCRRQFPSVALRINRRETDMSRKAARTGAILFIALALLPKAAAAQSAIAGQVKDNTGAVLPGVTVEAASPALIEGRRTAVTDGEGRFTIVNL